jgi:hypothetical protein
VPISPSSLLASARKPIELLTRPSRSTIFILSIVGKTKHHLNGSLRAGVQRY